MSNFVTSTPVRVSFPHVFEPHTIPGGAGDPKYSMTLLIPKTDTKMVQAISAVIEQVKKDGLTSKWQGKMPAKLETTLYDGDGTTPNGEPWGDECKGHWVLRTSSKNAPDVIDEFKQKCLDPKKIYAGCWCYVGVNFYPYASTTGKNGIGAGLNTVMFARDDEAFGGVGASATSDFAAIPTANAAGNPMAVNPLALPTM